MYVRSQLFYACDGNGFRNLDLGSMDIALGLHFSVFLSIFHLIGWKSELSCF